MKLLNRSIRSYLIYSFIIVLIAVPVFYFVIQAIVYEEVDEGLVAEKEEIIQHSGKLPGIDSAWGSKALGIQLTPASALVQRDSFYNTFLFDKISNEQIPYRVIEGGLIIGNKPYTIKLKRSLIDNEDLIQSIVIVMIILLILIVGGFLIINRVISKKIWKPFYNTVNKLNDYQLEKNEMPEFEKTVVDEFSDLNKSISTLIKRNLTVFQSQKEFTENAAHEMQTPLAILQGKLELLMQTHPLNSEQAGLISGLADANQRMNRLNRSLLLLTKIENNLFIEKEKISLNDTIEKTVDQFAMLAEQKNISIQNDTLPGITVEANRSLFEILVSNLLSNAIRHSPDHGTVLIGMNDHAELAISNTSKNGALDNSRIFQRFQKDSPDNNSTGLGLAIAGKICSLYQFNLDYSFTGSMHVFSVKF
jgi:signal transduction histidine kinase